MQKIVLACLLAAFAATSARAVVVCVAPTSTTAGSITITAPIVFTITTAGQVGDFVLSDWVTSDGTLNDPQISPNLAFSVNTTPYTSAADLFDNNYRVSSVTANDGVFYLVSVLPTAQPGNTVTLSAGTYTIPATSGFNPMCTQTFTGNMYVANTGDVRISNIVSAGAVPEPATWAMLSLGVVGAGAVTLRRRQMRA